MRDMKTLDNVDVKQNSAIDTVHDKCDTQNESLIDTIETKALPDAEISLEMGKLDCTLQRKPIAEHKLSGGRRVHVSAQMGMENDLSWRNTLLSIMPDTHTLKDPQKLPNLSRDKEEATSLREKPKICKEKHKYGILLTSSGPDSILHRITKADLRETFENFKGFLTVRIIRSKGISDAYVFFQTEEDMHQALNAKHAMVMGEELCMRPVQQPRDHEVRDLFKCFLDGMADSSHTAKKGTNFAFSTIFNQGDNHISCNTADKYSAVEQKLSSKKTLLSALDKVRCGILICGGVDSIHLESLEDFFSNYGDLIGCYEEVDTCGKRTLILQFKMESSKKKALEIQQFKVHGCVFRVISDALPNMLTIRLGNVHSNSIQSEVFSVCQEYGQVKSITPRGANSIDVHFSEDEKLRVVDILQRLNNVVFMERKWHAELLCEGFEAIDDAYLASCEECLRRREEILNVLKTAKQFVAQLEKLCDQT